MRFGVLGPLEVDTDGGPVALGGQKERLLLAQLLARPNQVVSVAALTRGLWGEHPPKSADKTLQSHVARLRRALESGRPRGAAAQVLVTRAPGYLLQVAPGALDAARFEQLTTQARLALASGEADAAASTLRAALGLWRGRAFEEFVDSDFGAAEADRLGELRLVAVEDRIEADLRLGRHRELVAELEGLVAEQPLRERLRGQLMLALYRSGRQADALLAYQRARSTLVEELGIDPSPALQRLERAILAQDPGLELVAPAGQHRQGAQPSVAAQQPQISNLPARNLAFTGRDHQLATLQQRLAASTPAVVVQPQALHGLGGVGKTQLALEHAHRHQGDYDLVWWVAAEQPATIPAQLAALARRLDIPEHADQAETIQALWDALRQRDRWLLVFDNADHPSDLEPWWPPGSGRVLVTSRHPTWGGLATPVEVDVLSRAEAIAFLQRRLGSHDPALGRLAEALGDLPLALEQAAAYLEETASPVTAYLQLLRDRARELFALGHPTSSEQTIATVWRVALARLRRQTPAAEDLLVLLAFLGADDIPRDLPTHHPDLLPVRLGAAVEDPLVYQQTVAALRLLALVTASRDGERLSVHRLVQAVVRHQLDPEQHQQWAATALRLVAAAFPTDETDPDAWPTYARLLPHALAVTGTTAAGNAEPVVAAGLLNNAGMYLWQRAEDQQARGLLERALAIREAHLGPDHPDTAQSLDNLGLALAVQADLQGARTLHERALSIHEAHLGADHLDTAESLHNLATVLRDQGHLQGARTLQERALAILEARLGADHPTTAHSLDNLADVLRDQGDLDHARTLHERALAIFEARLGADHPDTAWSLYKLATVLRDQGDLHGARTLQERALAILEARRGADHPTTALSLDNLALVLHAQGDLDRARPLFERALSIREARLGADHPDTVRSRERLAAIVAALENRE